MKIVIVGGGTAGWLAAHCLSKAQPGQHEIIVIESSNIGIIGVGEATTGLTKDLLNGLLFPYAVDVEDFIRKTEATNKMGILHKHWHKDHSSYFAPLDGSDSFQDNNDIIFKYALHKFGYDKFHRASRIGLNWDDKKYDEMHAYQFDTYLVGQFFREQCLKDNIKLIDAIVQDISVDEKGHISSLTLDQGYKVDADFFFDCTGFKRLLMEKMGSKWISYKKYLPVDTAIPFRLKYKDGETPLPCTTATALSSGWMWDIPLQSRRGCGYVFDSNFISHEKAVAEVEQYLGHYIEPIKVINFTSGKGDTFWKNNVLALGLCASFVEPLESTSIHNTIVQIMVFIDEFLSSEKDKTITADNQKAYNKNINELFEYVFNFLSLHYQGGREDSEFWRHIKEDKVVTEYTAAMISKAKNKIVGSVMFDNANPWAPGNALWNWVMAGLKIITPEQAERELRASGTYEIAENYYKHFEMREIDKPNLGHAWSKKPYIEYTK